MVLTLLWRRPAFFSLQKILLLRWYISLIRNSYCSSFADKFSRFVFMKICIFLQFLDPFIDLICLQLLQWKELQIFFLLEFIYTCVFPYLTWIITSLFFFLICLELLFLYFFPYLTWIATYLFLSLFIFFHICILLSLNFCIFSSLPQYFFFFAAISHRVHIRQQVLNHVFTLSIIKTNYMFPYFPIFPPFLMMINNDLLDIKTLC